MCNRAWYRGLVRIVATAEGRDALDQIERTDLLGYGRVLGVMAQMRVSGLHGLTVEVPSRPLQDLMEGETELRVAVDGTPYKLVLGLVESGAALLFVLGVTWTTQGV